MADDQLTPPTPPATSMPPSSPVPPAAKTDESAKPAPSAPVAVSPKPTPSQPDPSSNSDSTDSSGSTTSSSDQEPTVVFDDLLTSLQESLNKQDGSSGSPGDQPTTGAPKSMIADSSPKSESEDKEDKQDKQDKEQREESEGAPIKSGESQVRPLGSSSSLTPPTPPKPPAPPSPMGPPPPHAAPPATPLSTPTDDLDTPASPPSPSPAQPPLAAQPPPPPPSTPQAAPPPPPPSRDGLNNSSPPRFSPTIPPASPAPGQPPAPSAATSVSPPMTAGAGAGPATPSAPASSPTSTSPPPAVPRSDPSVKPELKQADAANVKKSPLRFLPFVIGILVVLGVLAFVAMRFLNLGPFSQPTVVAPPSTQQSGDGAGTATGGTGSTTSITYWGLWESSAVMGELIADFEREHPDIKVTYQQQQPREYRERLQEALQRGTGPDVFRYHATWVPMLRTQLAPAPATVLSSQQLSSEYFPAYSQDLVQSGAVLGVPLMYDGLALFYNTEIFQVAGATPPTSWSDLEELSKQLTIRTGTTIDRAGVAIGTTANVDNFSDILGLMILQNGGDPAKPTAERTQESLSYYASFLNTHKVWDNSLPSSTYAFATEKVAMILAPSWRAFEIRSINPNLEFGVAPVPQLPGNSVAWASYWVEGVSASSRNQAAAWEFLSYLSEQDSLQQFSQTAAQQTPRLFGPIYPRTAMADTLGADTYLSAFVQDAPIARSWYLSSRTFDNGLNDRIIKYYEDALNAIGQSSSSVNAAALTAEQGVQQILIQYGVIAPPVTTPTQ